ncbi:rod shape-determining protein MreC [Candidatus Uhrbacteria bacterium CG_4_9_14_3_um_filter_50_9]|uniref:Cell shape-determining protein MreC n=1 Tax=Candidatus Uhrbacteria bacterium CG_4_9_14_3_um_filter_50_9 TaxID=1975035 RepID=A0A2M7XDX5_9BACT|nr:MAG: rod shape-determining protein MreC [Candidatus Uhrbacteria bacterium CG_4_9_14_3_um_filter_50_9]
MSKRSLLSSRSARRLYLPAGVVLLLIILFFGRTVDVLSVIQRPLSALGTSIYEDVFYFLTAGSILPSELEVLIGQRDAYMVDQTELELLRDENNALMELLGFLERANYSTVSANITGRSIGPDSNRFLIDRGEEDGIHEGQAVVVGEGFIIGKVLSTGPYTSTVTVLSDPDMALAVSILNETRTIGIVEGGMGNLLTMSFVPEEERIEVNDIVVTSGLDESVPSGLLVGVINAIVVDDQTPFQEAVVEPVADAHRYSQVLVILTDTL